MQKTWFITGAERGIGAGIARVALRAGDRVVAADRDPVAVRALLGPDDGRLITVALDVNDEPQAARAVAAAVARFGGIDVLVNSAAVGRLGTDLFGVFNVTRNVLPAMRKARTGRVFNVSSPAGAGRGLEGFSQSLALQVATFNIHVTIVDSTAARPTRLAEALVRLADDPEPPMRFTAPEPTTTCPPRRKATNSRADGEVVA